MSGCDLLKNWVVLLAQTAAIGAAGYASRDVIIPAAPKEDHK